MMNDMNFKVDQDHGVVVCTLYNCKDIARNRIRKYCPTISLGKNQYLIRDKFTGVAKCAPEDKWDEGYGKKLALKRAKYKRCRAVNITLKACYCNIHNSMYNMLRYGVHKLIDESEE